MRFIQVIFRRVMFVFPVLFLAIGSCSDNTQSPNNPNVQQTDFKYPYSLNSFWYYTTYNFVANYRPDSIRSLIPPDTIVGYGSALFTSDTVIAQDTFRILRNTHSSEGHTHTTIELYKQNDTGLIRHAYYSSGTNFGPFRSGNSVRYNFHGNEYLRISDLKNAFSQFDSQGDTSLTFDDPPILALKYPVSESSEWPYLDYGATKITKKYSGYDEVALNGRSYFCAKVKRNWYINNSTTPDPNLQFFDFFAKEGMVKRGFVIANVLVSNSLGEPIGYIDVWEQAILNLYTDP
jgi:hypothetical protein